MLNAQGRRLVARISRAGLRRNASTVSGSTEVSASTGSTVNLNPTIADYKPSADDFEKDPQLAGLNYPPINGVNRAHRKPLGWWDNQQRVNFNEPLAENDDVLGFLAPAEPKYPASVALKQIAIALGTIGTICYALYKIEPEPRWAPQEFPRNGLAGESPQQLLSEEGLKEKYGGSTDE